MEERPELRWREILRATDQHEYETIAQAPRSFRHLTGAAAWCGRMPSAQPIAAADYGDDRVRFAKFVTQRL